MSTNISAKTKFHSGNPFLARKRRKERLKEGVKVAFTFSEDLDKNNPFGDFSKLNLWNESIAFTNYLRRIVGQPRDFLGRFVKRTLQ